MATTLSIASTSMRASAGETKVRPGNEAWNRRTSRGSQTQVTAAAMRATSGIMLANITWSPIPCSPISRTRRPSRSAAVGAVASSGVRAAGTKPRDSATNRSARQRAS